VLVINNSSDIAAYYGVAIAARAVCIVSRFFPGRHFRADPGWLSAITASLA
jgi:uncharacterized protein